MANSITRHIPNTLTCLNLFSGSIACVMAFGQHYKLALVFIIVSAVFDFLDGFAARALKAYSAIGKDLDSLADDISFGLAPAAVVYSLFTEMHYPEGLAWIAPYLPYGAFLIAVFSGLRLAKFNNDTRQTSSFIGLPVPANALFWGAIGSGMHSVVTGESFHPLYLFVLVCLSSWLLVSEIPMFSLKFKNFSWKDNKVSFIFLLICIPLLAIFGVSGFAIIILWYIVLSLCTQRG